MVERAVAIDPALEHYSGLVALAAYHARTGMAELDQAKQLFDTALAKTEGKNLMVQLNYGTKYACMKGDAALYQDMLNKVLQAPDPDPYAAPDQRHRQAARQAVAGQEARQGPVRDRPRRRPATTRPPRRPRRSPPRPPSDRKKHHAP